MSMTDGLGLTRAVMVDLLLLNASKTYKENG